MRISDWSSDVCSSDLSTAGRTSLETSLSLVWLLNLGSGTFTDNTQDKPSRMSSPVVSTLAFFASSLSAMYLLRIRVMAERMPRSEEHTSELQSLMRISYAVFCLKKKKQTTLTNQNE